MSDKLVEASKKLIVKLDFDIVIATRNRQPILKLCLQTLLSQSRLPHRLIVVDSSDDHASVQRLVENASKAHGAPIDVRVLRSEPGTCYQRNVGLQHVESPVVMFPDDDVLWFPGVAEAVMQIYERDHEGIVGCVACADSPIPPQGAFKQGDAPYQVRYRDRFASKVFPLTRPFEARLFADPLHPAQLWMKMWGKKSAPAWLSKEGAELCGPVSGYRMSFRTAVISKLGGFDEVLGRYGLYEDSDASIGSLHENINVCAKQANVFHYRDPGQRTHSAEWGMMAVLNRAYIVCKHSDPGSAARRHLTRYLYYQVFRYMLQAHSQYGRRRLQGALYALANTPRLINAPKTELIPQYLAIRREFAKGF